MTNFSPISLSLALKRLSEEVRDLHSVSLELQDIVSELGSGVPQRAQTALARIQRLDRLTQELEDIGPLLERLSAHAISNDHPNVSPAVNLTRLVSLKNRLMNMEINSELEVPGEAELF